MPLTEEESYALVLSPLDRDTLDLVEVTLPALKTLYDHFEEKLLDAVDDGDRVKATLYSWYYGRIAGAVTDFESVDFEGGDDSASGVADGVLRPADGSTRTDAVG